MTGASAQDAAPPACPRAPSLVPSVAPAAPVAHRAAAVPAALAEEARRVRYFSELVLAGHRAALQPGLACDTLRAERIALRIPLPELDAVPLWSVRRADGMISIPFIEYILGQMLASANRIVRTGLRRTGGDPAGMLPGLRRALFEVNSGGPEALSLPRLNDVYLPAELVGRLTAPDGILQRVVRHSEALAGLGEAGGLTLV